MSCCCPPGCCGPCNGYDSLPPSYTITAVGFTDGASCTCSAFNGSFVLTWTGCEYRYVSGSVKIEMYNTGSFGGDWRVRFTNTGCLIEYQFNCGTWSTTSCSVSTASQIGASPCGLAPATVTATAGSPCTSTFVGCCSELVPNTLTATISGCSGLGFNGQTVTLTRIAGSAQWSGSLTVSGHTLDLLLKCDSIPGCGPPLSQFWILLGGCGGSASIQATRVSVNCNPFQLVFQSFFNCGCSMTLTITS